MKLYQNVISNELQQKCIDEIEINSQKRMWTSSSVCWPENIRDNISGSCISCDVGDLLADELTNSISKYLPEHNKLNFQFYIWQYDSGISLHDDYTHKFGATIYLNDQWHINYGGIFLWYETMEDFHVGNVKGLVPQGRTMVVNDKQQLHLVTPLSSSSPSFRITIQIWGK